MDYSTLMVQADLGRRSEGLLRVTADLATLFKAHVIGIAACQPMLLSYGDGYMSGDVIEQDRAEIDREAEAAETRFRAALADSRASLEWRSAVGFIVLTDYVAEQARAADLVVSSPEPANVAETSKHVRVGELVMRLGRPVLIVPDAAVSLDMACAMIAWKDTRETRRAVTDALPLLRRAGRVVVAEVAAADELAAARTRLLDVVAWLGRHGIAAESVAEASDGDDMGRLDGIAREHGAGLLVAGAYGHSRVREWVLGGVTRDLLREPARCTLVSH